MARILPTHLKYDPTKYRIIEVSHPNDDTYFIVEKHFIFGWWRCFLKKDEIMFGSGATFSEPIKFPTKQVAEDALVAELNSRVKPTRKEVHRER